MESSGIGTIAERQATLHFCAERGSAPEAEITGPGAVNAPYRPMLASDVRYRFVIDVDTLR